jgi:hypothetical protein
LQAVGRRAVDGGSELGEALVHDCGHDGIAVGEVSVDRIFMGLLILIPVRNTTKSPSIAALNRPG